MAALKFTRPRVLPFRVALKAALLTTVLVVVPLYTALAWAETGHPVRGALEGFLLLSVALGGWLVWRLLRWFRFRRGGPGLGPQPSVREPRPPGRPPALSAAACAEEDRE